MKILHQDEFSEMKFDEKTGIQYHILYATTEKMTNQQFQEMLLIWLQTTIATKASKSMVDTRDMQFPITPELQEWLVNHVVLKSPIKKSAFIVPTAFIENLAIGQFIDEANEAGIKTEGYFATVEAAEAWLLNDRVQNIKT